MSLSMVWKHHSSAVEKFIKDYQADPCSQHANVSIEILTEPKSIMEPYVLVLASSMNDLQAAGLLMTLLYRSDAKEIRGPAEKVVFTS